MLAVGKFSQKHLCCTNLNCFWRSDIKKIREKNFWIKDEIMAENLELLNLGS